MNESVHISSLKNLMFKKTTSVTQTVGFVQPDYLLQEGNQVFPNVFLKNNFKFVFHYK